MSEISAVLIHGPAYLGPYLLVLAVSQAAARRFGGGVGARIAVAVVCVVAVLIPVNEVPLAGYAHVVIGGLSVPTLALLVSVSLGPVGAWSALLDRRNRNALIAVGALLAVALYPSALGFLPVDLYRWGYAPMTLAVVLLVVTIGMWAAGRRAAAWVLVCAVLAYQAGSFGSPNLWDYVTDPYLPIVAVAMAAIQAVRFAAGRRAATRR